MWKAGTRGLLIRPVVLTRTRAETLYSQSAHSSSRGTSPQNPESLAGPLRVRVEGKRVSLGREVPEAADT